MRQKEGRQFGQGGNRECQSHGRFVRTELSHIREQVRGSGKGANTTQEGNKEKTEPTAVGQKQAEATRLYFGLVVRAMHKLLTNEKVDQHNSRKCPEPSSQTII